MKQEEIGQSLLEAFARVLDRRSVHGRRHPRGARFRHQSGCALLADHLTGAGARAWPIENAARYVRDVTLDEDASTVRSGCAPRVLAVLRHYAWHPVSDLLRLLGIRLS